jgi:hypothetical protein
MEGLATEWGEEKVVMIGPTCLKAHRTTSTRGETKGSNNQGGRLIGRRKDQLNTGLHAARTPREQPMNYFMTTS